MDEPASPVPLEGTLIHGVTLVDRLTRPDAGEFAGVSLPDHLIHVVVEGRVEQRASGLSEQYGAGDAVWYHENESVQGRILEAPWTFYTINFAAPALPPPAIDQRVRAVGPGLREQAEQLLVAWRDVAVPPMVRQMRVHARLLDVLAALTELDGRQHRVDDQTQLWWEIEARLRADLSVRIDLASLQRTSGHSHRAICRACHLAVGVSPIKRVKELRLSYARGLVQHSTESISEIAYRVGYGRVQEFSRDFRRRYGATPTAIRRAGPDYRAEPGAALEHADPS